MLEVCFLCPSSGPTHWAGIFRCWRPMANEDPVGWERGRGGEMLLHISKGQPWACPFLVGGNGAPGLRGSALSSRGGPGKWPRPEIFSPPTLVSREVRNLSLAGQSWALSSQQCMHACWRQLQDSLKEAWQSGRCFVWGRGGPKSRCQRSVLISETRWELSCLRGCQQAEMLTIGDF